MNPLISIIIPVFNTPNDKIQRCLNSILCQNDCNYEIILVDDGSKAECADFLNSIEKQHPTIIRVIHKANEGSAVARNTGVLHANGEYGVFIDSDDYIYPTLFNNAAEIIAKYNPDLVMGLIQKIINGKRINVLQKNKKSPEVLFLDSQSQRSQLLSHILGDSSDYFIFENGYLSDGPVAKICKIQILKESLFTPESFCNDDTIWNIKVLKKCETILIFSKPWYVYDIGLDSKTHKYRKDAVYEVNYRIHQQLSLIKELWPECLQGIYTRIWRDTNILCRVFLFHPQNSSKLYEKYRIFKKFIHSADYLEMLKNITFESETNQKKRILKKMTRFFSLHGPNILSFFIWKQHTKKTVS